MPRRPDPALALVTNRYRPFARVREPAEPTRREVRVRLSVRLPHPLRRGPLRMRSRVTCPKFLTTSEYTPRLRARLDRGDQLIADAQQRGWQREVERHQATRRRLEQLLHDLA